MSTDTAVLVIAHGSRVAAANAEVVSLARQLAGASGLTHVRAAFLEQAHPSIPEGLAGFIAEGAQRILILPLFLNTGRHLRDDIPQIVRAAQEAHPDITIKMTPHLGSHEGLHRLLLDLITPYTGETAPDTPA